MGDEGETGERDLGNAAFWKMEECESILQEKSKISPSLGKTFMKKWQGILVVLTYVRRYFAYSVLIVPPHF